MEKMRKSMGAKSGSECHNTDHCVSIKYCRKVLINTNVFKASSEATCWVMTEIQMPNAQWLNADSCVSGGALKLGMTYEGYPHEVSRIMTHQIWRIRLKKKTTVRLLNNDANLKLCARNAHVRHHPWLQKMVR